LLLGVQIIVFKSSCQNRDARLYLIRPICQSPNVATGMNHQPIATVNLKGRAPLSRHLFKYATDGSYKMPKCLSLIQPITLCLSKLSHLQRMASNDNNDKHKLEEEVESSMARKRLRLSDDDTSDADSSDSPKEETEEEEVSLEETSMNQLNTSKEKLQAKRVLGMSLHLRVKAISSNPCKSDSESATPTQNVREAPLCFAGSQRYRRSLGKGLERQVRRKCLGASRLRTRVEGGMPAVIRRLPCHHRHVSVSYWKYCKVMS
jgi:hypothetical protein